MEAYIDLHVHSNCSDGTFSPEELVSYARKKGLQAFALTDHDTVTGVARAADAAAGTGLTVIPGVELSSDYQKRDIHILGLGIDAENRKFLKYLEEFQAAREIRNHKMMKKLAQRGIPINKEVMETAFPGCVWTRAHFARFLKDRGFVRTMEEGFQKYVGDEASCFVPKEQIPPWEAVRLILECGGHPVLAHPLLYRLSSRELEKLVDLLCGSGLQGLEAIYSANRFSDESSMKQLAKRHGLCVTGGSDFHGSNKPDIDLGIGKGNLKIPYSLRESLSRRAI